MKNFHQLLETVRIRFPSRLDCVPQVVSYLTAVAARLGLVDPEVSNFPVALDEALTNAVVHGNGKDEGKSVDVEAVFSLEKVRVSIRDQGSGFDFRSLPNPLHKGRLQKTHGRGIFLIRALVDEVRFNAAGNEVTLVQFAADKPAPSPSSRSRGATPAPNAKTP